jgi:hypothetical protein
MRRAMFVRGVIGLLFATSLHPCCQAQLNIEEPPISYTATDDNNLVSDLITKLDSGEIRLEYERDFGYLRSLLRELEISINSQVLVFSKTSLQVQYISRRNPRAIYFNDEVYVGWVRGSSLMEISTNDPKLGAAFYTVDMMPGRARVRRANYDCLACHISTLTQGVPGHTVRSVLPKIDGTIDIQKKSFVTNHKSPFSERWGGWYVTGRHGEMKHMGNAFLRGGQLETDGNDNRLNLRDQFDTSGWLSHYSDIVALMVLEHQTQMHNVMTKADFTVRRAIYDHNLAYSNSGSSSADAAEDDAGKELQLTISQAAKEVVDYLLFCGEAPLTSKVSGSILFSNEFQERGPTDESGRSLREFDLQSRLFKYPCSYLIYSNAYDSLEQRLRQQVYRQLWDVLNGHTRGDQYAHLDTPTRESILEILRSTKAGLPKYWTNSRQSD